MSIKKLDRYEALIIDDISYIPFNRDETDVLFVLLAERYETRSVIMTSQSRFQRLGDNLQRPDDDQGGG